MVSYTMAEAYEMHESNEFGLALMHITYINKFVVRNILLIKDKIRMKTLIYVLPVNKWG